MLVFAEVPQPIVARRRNLLIQQKVEALAAGRTTAPASPRSVASNVASTIATTPRYDSVRQTPRSVASEYTSEPQQRLPSRHSSAAPTPRARGDSLSSAPRPSTAGPRRKPSTRRLAPAASAPALRHTNSCVCYPSLWCCLLLAATPFCLTDSGNAATSLPCEQHEEAQSSRAPCCC